MAKWTGMIGFATSEEIRPGVWAPMITEHKYYGDVIRNTRRIYSSDKANDDIDISNELSIIADPYARENFHTIRYAEFMGAKWRVSNVDVQYPRLILTLGGVYNGEAT